MELTQDNSSTEPSRSTAGVKELLHGRAVTVCELEELRLVPFSDPISLFVASKQYPGHVQPPLDLTTRAFRPAPTIRNQHYVELYLHYHSRRGGTR
jgi:hypothetical protein